MSLTSQIKLVPPNAQLYYSLVGLTSSGINKVDIAPIIIYNKIISDAVPTVVIELFQLLNMAMESNRRRQ